MEATEATPSQSIRHYRDLNDTDHVAMMTELILLSGQTPTNPSLEEHIRDFMVRSQNSDALRVMYLSLIHI